ncbi:hypothetical protein AMTRI_Chr04g244780 [Amborella trichopoda]|uniref:CG-1 domain-containing protein n=1 Tax=Amborella trichopoda TaxID=13333 RepID=U5D2P6_AMBTC|nr:calmodulin-binding transcription activator 2 [Amborella trichopoda]ERN14613.1 hypothetical protein AMTR_s00038p00173360 [Amborella trichopoda]|eukprot:XP_006853146.3 calmodulin-binding transcription activator 2 [Amborella trichopoda]
MLACFNLFASQINCIRSVGAYGCAVMAESRHYALSNPLDISQIVLEAQNRWLRPAEVCEILRNYHNFHIASDPPNRPPSGSLFLFDRKVLRYFRKDGHNWRKKKDGKTVREAHERLKAGRIDVLHCYYAHGEENENFQRRSYWLLEEELEHIVLVHYREVKGNKTGYGRSRDAEKTFQVTPTSSPVHSASLNSNPSQLHSQTTPGSSMSIGQSEYEDAESGNPQVTSRYKSLLELQQPEYRLQRNQKDADLLNSYLEVLRTDNIFKSHPLIFTSKGNHHDNQSAAPEMSFVSHDRNNVLEEKNIGGFEMNQLEPRKQMDMASWSDVLGHGTMGSSDKSVYVGGLPNKQFNGIFEQLFAEDISTKSEALAKPYAQEEWQIASSEDSSKATANTRIHTEQGSEPCGNYQQSKYLWMKPHIDQEPFSIQFGNLKDSCIILKDGSFPEVGHFQESKSNEDEVGVEEYAVHSRFPEQPLLKSLSKTEGEEGLKKLDSFSRWMSNEFGGEDVVVSSESRSFWSTLDSTDVVDDSRMPHQLNLGTDSLSPSISQDQLFSIIDFSPTWAYSGLDCKVLITGTFLMNQNQVEKCQWSCMFGEVEVPAQVLTENVLRCHTPSHASGRVPFYVTCSNRVACSEIREFEFLDCAPEYMDTFTDIDNTSTNEMVLRVRLASLLSLGSSIPVKSLSSNVREETYISGKINSLLKDNDDEWFQIENLTDDEDLFPGKAKDQLVQKLLKEKLHAWLLVKAGEDGKGPNVLDTQGQGVLHLTSALGYDWAIAPIVAAGVNINFRDVSGWTALHWAASCGRERTVAAIIALGGAPGALSDPTPKFSSGQTPADLASVNGHKGIAGYLAESALTSHLSKLTIEEAIEDGNELALTSENALEPTNDEIIDQFNDGDSLDGLSLRNSLTAVRNAAQAAARIHEVFRVQSFHRKKLIEYGDDKFGMSDERALSLISVQKMRKTGNDEPVHAAVRIQRKFRGWKGRKEFLVIRQRIVHLQAFFRGYQVRKHYKKIIWSVGIVEKAILRWRRKGSGLRGFKPEASIEGPNAQAESSQSDDYDFLKVGRRQTEERLDKALARVQSMVQYPEARAQYRRLMNVVNEFQESKVDSERLLRQAEEIEYELIDCVTLEEEDTIMG